jgi:uncharacterized protein with ATP-grasp and redox domains
MEGEMSTLVNKHGRFTGIASDCYSCIIGQSRSAARLAELSEEQTNRVIAVAEKWLKESRTTPLFPQHIIRYVADAIIQERGEPHNFDIYKEVKDKSNVLSMSYADSFQKKINDSESPFETGLKIAAAGNIIDFFIIKYNDSLNLEKELQSLDKIPFATYDIDPFKRALMKSSTLLYVCDNCGEIVFDMLFIKEIQRKYPNLHIVTALRDMPILNDATLDDAKTVGLDRFVKVISSGSIYPGTIYPETTEEFQKLFSSADVILVKGQGNFETLLPLADKRLFFLLRIKCEKMAALSKVQIDNLVLMQGNNDIVTRFQKTIL